MVVLYLSNPASQQRPTCLQSYRQEGETAMLGPAICSKGHHLVNVNGNGEHTAVICSGAPWTPGHQQTGCSGPRILAARRCV